jgi:hypothetical protein
MLIFALAISILIICRQRYADDTPLPLPPLPDYFVFAISS